MSNMSHAGRYFGRLWSRGYESLLKDQRTIIRIEGKNSGKYLQGLTTSDVLNYEMEHLPRSEIPIPSSKPNDVTNNHTGNEVETKDSSSTEDLPVPTFNPRLQPTCFLDERGRVLSDGMIWKPPNPKKVSTAEEIYNIEVPTSSKDIVLKHLNEHKVGRSTKKVSITDVTDSTSSIHAIYGTLLSSNDESNNNPLQMGLDPRHPSLGLRLLSSYDETTPEERHSKLSQMLDERSFPLSNGTYQLLRHLNGIAEGYDELHSKTPLECNMDWLGDTISFHKGCYLGQELTARSFYKGVVRKRIMPLFFVDTQTELPPPWKYSHKQYRERMIEEANNNDEEQDSSTSDRSDVVRNMPPEIIEEEAGNELYNIKVDSLFGGLDFLPLPRLGVYDAAAVMSILQGIHPKGKNPIQNMPPRPREDSSTDKDAKDIDLTASSSNEEQKTLSEKLAQRQLELIQELKQFCHRGSKITNHYNGQTIGEVISLGPFENSSLVLAQVRLEYVHLFQSSTSVSPRTTKKNVSSSSSDDESEETVDPEDHTQWKPTNKVKVGDSKMEMRMLPYVPLWWPKIDFSNGKAAN